MLTDIFIDNVSIGYKEPVASGLNAKVGGGTLTCLIGANGTGKSTLLKTLSGFLPPKFGRIVVGGHDLSTMSRHVQSRTIGIVLTGRPGLLRLSVEDTVGLGRSPYTGLLGRLSADDHAAVSSAMDSVGIGAMRHRSIATLSDGECQKVMIAKALAQQTPVILLDEPTAFLDFPSKAALMRLLHSLAHDEHKTILMSTHDLELAWRLSDRMLRLSPNGLHDVSPDDVRREIDEATMKEPR